MITGFYAAVLSVFLVVLVARVIRKRWIYKIGIGTGGNDDLARAVRVHGNFIETVPWILILMLVLEIDGASPVLLHSYGAALLVARTMHAWGLTQTAGASIGRTGGMVLTIGLILIGAGLCAARFLRG